MSELLLDRAGRRCPPATMPGFHARRPPANKGVRYPADPPKVEEIIAVMCAAGDNAHGGDFAARSPSYGGAAAAFGVHCPSPKPISTIAAARSWSGAARAD